MSGLTVLAEGEGWVAIDKPPGLLVIPGRTPQDQVCARDLLSEQLSRRVWVCHRLDRDTSGVVLFATNEATHRAASMAFEHGLAHKRYWALVEGRVEGPLDIDERLIAGRKGKVRVAGPSEDGKPAQTRVHPLETFAGASWVECEPMTGRQHQIRVHLAARGHPLLFDHQYGRKSPIAVGSSQLSRTPLHAASLSIPSLAITAGSPVPADLTAVLEALRAGNQVR